MGTSLWLEGEIYNWSNQEAQWFCKDRVLRACDFTTWYIQNIPIKIKYALKENSEHNSADEACQEGSLVSLGAAGLSELLLLYSSLAITMYGPMCFLLTKSSPRSSALSLSFMAEVECLMKLQIRTALWPLRKSHLPWSSCEKMWMTDASVQCYYKWEREISSKNNKTGIIFHHFLLHLILHPFIFRSFIHSSTDRLLLFSHSMDMSLGNLRELVMDREAWSECCGSWGRKESDTTEQLNWTLVVTDSFRPHGL